MGNEDVTHLLDFSTSQQKKKKKTQPYQKKVWMIGK